MGAGVQQGVVQSLFSVSSFSQITSGLVRAGTKENMGVEMYFVVGTNKTFVLVPLNSREHLEGREGAVILPRLPRFR